MKSNRVRRLAYCSVSAIPLTRSQGEVRSILDASVVRNRGLGVTGALTLVQDVFFQVLEGPAAAVGEILASVRRDARNQQVVVVADDERSGRDFSEWEMHFAEPYSPERKTAYELLTRMRGGDRNAFEPMLSLLKHWSRPSLGARGTGA